MKCSIILILFLFKELCANEVKNVINNKNLSKRGIFQFGSGFSPSPYASYFGYQNPLTTSGNIQQPLGVNKLNLINSVPYILKSGSAVVSSYNVNYPRYPYVENKAQISTLPYPGFVGPLSPISVTFVPNIPHPAPLNPIVPSNILVPTNPFTPVQIAPQKPFIIPISFPETLGSPSINHPQPVIPSTIGHNTPTPPISMLPAYVPVQPAQPVQPVRPFIVHHNVPTSTNDNPIQTPPISLLPPYGDPSDRHESESIPQVNRGYLVPNTQRQFPPSQFVPDQQQPDGFEAENQPRFLESENTQPDQNRYFGASSYDVPLQGNKGYSY